jgi:hypothetical protein
MARIKYHYPIASGQTLDETMGAQDLCFPFIWPMRNIHYIG